MTLNDTGTGFTEKLRVLSETVRKLQDIKKENESALEEKDRLIKVLGDRLLTGTDGILVSNRQRELNIKNLELKIQKLLKENEELVLKMDAIKAEICARCETKFLLRENNENKNISKSYKPSGKGSGVLSNKKTVPSVCPDRTKSLENIIEHKDKRINHLIKEIQRLNKTEKELTQKVYRLTKLHSMSGLPSETVTDCLLKEIQLLESQKQSDDMNQLHDDLSKLKSKSSVSDNASLSNASNSNRRLIKSASNIKQSSANMSSCRSTSGVGKTDAENEVLFKKLQKLCSDINELKRLFMHESEKLSHGINSTAKEYNIFKIQLEEIINNLNDVVERIRNDNYFNAQGNIVTDVESDDKYVISCLQERLKESLGMVTEYEKENKALKENLYCLKKQSEQKNIGSYKTSEDEMFSSPLDPNLIQNTNDVEKLKEIIKMKDKQLESADSHINTCQKFIKELEKTVKHSTFDASKMPCSSGTVDERRYNSCEKQNKTLETKLEVAERNLKTCKTAMEEFQNSIEHLEVENTRLELELQMSKIQNMPEGIDPEIKAKLSSGGSQITMLKKLNQELHERVKSLEEVNSKFEADIKTCKTKNSSVDDRIKSLEDVNAKLEEDIKTYKAKNSSLGAIEKENALLQAQLKASEKHISSLEKNVETLQDKLDKVEGKKNKLEVDLKEINQLKNLAETYENDVLALKNELIMKEGENKNLKESLHTLENKSLEMKHYRKSLHSEIETLCTNLMENEDSEDSARRKAIYKAAVLHSAQALLQLDDNYNLKPEDSHRDSAVEEMEHQINVYLTEVSRIHELVTIKEQERDGLLREYLDLDDDVLKPSSLLHHNTNVQGVSADPNLQSFPNLDPLSSSEYDQATSSRTTKSVKFKSDKSDIYEILTELKIVQEELANTKSVTNYLVTSCTKLEDLLAKEKTDRAKCESKLEVQQETIRELKCQLTVKENTAETLNNLIEMMRSTECNNEITLEQLKSSINYLMDENQKRFERVTVTQLELCKCKEENARIQNELDLLKREICNEKYENAKINNELKCLRLRISRPRSNLNGAS